MGKEWIELKEMGQLYIEKVLVTFDLPILFVCKNFENRKYLCSSVDDESGIYVIAETQNEKLLDMLKNKVTMESVFRNCEDGRIIITEYDFENKRINTDVQPSGSVSGELLPDKDALFKLKNDAIEDYIAFLKKQTVKASFGNNYEMPKIKRSSVPWVDRITDTVH